MGQGDFEVEYPPLHDLAVSEQPVLAWVHDYLLKLDPVPHKRTFLKAFHSDQTADFCSSCHKVHLDVPVNKYRWFRGFNDYDNWQASGMSGQGARSFYYPPKPQKCADCHMPMVASADPAARDGKVHSHRFPAANTALPFVNGDHEQLRITQEFLKDNVVSVDVFGLVTGDAPREPAQERRGAGSEPRLASTFAIGEEGGNLGAAPAVFTKPVEVMAPLGKVDAALRRGEDARVEVVVRTREDRPLLPRRHRGRLRRVGRAGSGRRERPDDLSQRPGRWTRARDRSSRERTSTGASSSTSAATPSTSETPGRRARWPTCASSRRGRPTPSTTGSGCRRTAATRSRSRRRSTTASSPGGIPSGPSRGSAIRRTRTSASLRATTTAAGRFTASTANVSGKVKAIPDIPITVMASAEATVRVLPKGASLPEAKPYLDPSVRERWNDYGIGLLLQGDLRGAEAAFLKVTQMEPAYADGWVNVGRVRLQEGNLEGAEEVLRKALEVDPNLAKTHFFLGSALKSLGRYDEALEHTRIAQAQYPRDRVVRTRRGGCSS